MTSRPRRCGTSLPRSQSAARSFAARSNLGACLAKQGKLDEAIAEFREALRLKPDFAPVQNNLGLALAEGGKLDEAIAEYQSVLRIMPNFPHAHSNLGDALRRKGKLEEAIAECRTALRLKPEFPDARDNLGAALMLQGKLEEAIAEVRESLRLKPSSPEARAILGAALIRQGKLEEAIAELHEALRLRPSLSEAHDILADALHEQGKMDGAIAELREAVRFKPDFAEFHLRLSKLLYKQCRFVEALAELKQAHELGSKNPNWRHPSAEWVREIERLVELDHKLPAIVSGKAKPSNAAEMLAFAQLCYKKKLHGASVRFWSEAFQSQPKLAEDMQVQNRYNAACAAAMAGCGQGKDDPPLDDTAKARWRKQAIDWLKADLAAWTKIVESGPPQARQAVSQTLQHWKVDTDLAGIRDPAALAKLPADEQAACRALWAQVEALLGKSGARTSTVRVADALVGQAFKLTSDRTSG